MWRNDFKSTHPTSIASLIVAPMHGGPEKPFFYERGIVTAIVTRMKNGRGEVEVSLGLKMAIAW
jgi:hypothetical protein